MFSYKPWPARVVNIYLKANNIQAAWVEFFGTFQLGEVFLSNCVLFGSCADLLSSYSEGSQKPFKILNNLNKNRDNFLKQTTKKQQYLQSIRDAELYVGIPNEMSFLNSIVFLD